jgi:hypothetical protein
MHQSAYRSKAKSELPAFSIIVSRRMAEVNVLIGPEFVSGFSSALSFLEVPHELKKRNRLQHNTEKNRALK